MTSTPLPLPRCPVAPLPRCPVAPLPRCRCPGAFAPVPLPLCRCPVAVAPLPHCPVAPLPRCPVGPLARWPVGPLPLPRCRCPVAVAPLPRCPGAVAPVPLPLPRCPVAVAPVPLPRCRCPGAVAPLPLQRYYYVYCCWPLWQPLFYGINDRLCNWKHLPAHRLHEITQIFGLEKSLSLPLFHSFIGCDTTSSFLGIGKKTAWAAWQAYPYFTETQFSLISICIWHALDCTVQQHKWVPNGE